MFDWVPNPWSPEWQAFFSYITGEAHQAFYASFLLIVVVTFLGSALALIFGIGGAAMARARTPLLSIPGRLYINMVRGIPDVMFFLFFPIAILLTIKVVRTWLYCDLGTPLFEGINFVGCDDSDFIGSPNSWFAYFYNFGIACLAFGIVFGAFVANVIRGALNAVPAAQLETAAAFGFTPFQIFWRIHVPQMWVYAWGGLTNVWVLVSKATSLLSLLGIHEAVRWANQLGAPVPELIAERTGKYAHGDWAVYYFLLLFVFFIAFTFVSETGFARLKRRIAPGMVGVA